MKRASITTLFTPEEPKTTLVGNEDLANALLAKRPTARQRLLKEIRNKLDNGLEGFDLDDQYDPLRDYSKPEVCSLARTEDGSVSVEVFVSVFVCVGLNELSLDDKQQATIKQDLRRYMKMKGAEGKKKKAKQA